MTIAQLKRALRRSVDTEFKKGLSAFFKDTPKLHGVRVPDALKIADSYFRVYRPTLEETKDLASALIHGGWFEEGRIAFHLMRKHAKAFGKAEFRVFEQWLRHVDNWAWSDWHNTTLVAHAIENEPALAKEMLRWADAKSRWMVRGAAVSLIPLVKKGKHLHIALKVARKNMRHTDDLIQKGTGWMLREAAKADKQRVYDFLWHHRKTMPRTMLRYAIERFSKVERDTLMGKI